MSATRFHLKAYQTSQHPFNMEAMATSRDLASRISDLFKQQEKPNHVDISHWLSNSTLCTFTFKRKGLDFTAKVDSTELLSMIDIIMSLPENTPESEYNCSFRARVERDVKTPGREEYSSTNLKMDSTEPLPLSKIRAFIAVQRLVPPTTVELHLFHDRLSLL